MSKDMHSETGIWAGKQATPLSQAEIDIGLLEDRLVDFLDRYGEVMKGNAAAFGSRLDRGWVPPSLDDVDAELAKDS